MEETDTTEITEEKTPYEIMILLAPNLAEKDLEKNLDEVKEIINSNGGAVVNEDIWGIRDLAYRIKKHDTGFYAVYNFNLPPEKIREFNPILNINQDVLKYLISKTPKFYEFKTREQYEQEAEEEKKEIEKAAKEKEKEKERKKSAKPTPTAKKEEDKGLKEIPKEEVVEKKEEVGKEPAKEVKEEVKEEAVEEKAETKEKEAEAKEKTKAKLDEVDEKLKSIINDPDITL